MTALQMQFGPHFPAPIIEDPMELTSDIDQRAEGADDIDIDLDLTGDGEDDLMGEEDMNALADLASAERQEPPVPNDDEMADDGYAQGLIDEGSSVRDEDIEDAEYTRPELDDDTSVKPDAELPNEQPQELLAFYEEVVGDSNHEQDYHEQENDQQECQGYPATPETESGVNGGVPPNEQMEPANPSHGVAEIATGESPESYYSETTREATINQVAADQSTQPCDVDGLIDPEAKLGQTGAQVLPLSSDEEVVAQSNVEELHAQEEDHLNSSAHLHPIVLDYQGDEMFLFPPVNQSGEHASTFLLADEQLAYSTIGSLLKACRCVLKESLVEQDELMISFAELDLHISESTIECASIRLSEVVDLYFRLQQNDGLENPPPLYMDLTARNKFPHRLNVLRKASIEGTGLSQLRSSHETDVVQQNRTGRETDKLNHTAVLSSNEASASEREPGEVEGSMDQYDSHGLPLPLENFVLETDSVAQGTLSYSIKDVAHEDNNRYNRLERLFGGDSSADEAGVSGGNFSEAAGVKESPEPVPLLADDSKVQRMEESIVDEGDFIDYEDAEDAEGGTSSASSTLRSDTINVDAIHDHAIPNEPIIVQDQEHPSIHNAQEDAVGDEKTLYTDLHKKLTNNDDVPVEEGQPDAAEIPSQDSGGQGQIIFRQFDDEREASGQDQDANISHGTEPHLKANVDDQHEASTQYEDGAGSYWRGPLHNHADQTEDAAADFNGDVEDYSSRHPLDSGSSGSRRISRDDDLERVKDLEVENELAEADRLLTNDDDDNDVLLPPGEVNLHPSLSVDELAQTQEDDDEITYEDEEYDIDIAKEPVQANHNVTTSPGSRKRPRSLHENDDTLEEDFQDAKRVRPA